MAEVQLGLSHEDLEQHAYQAVALAEESLGLEGSILRKGVLFGDSRALEVALWELEVPGLF